MVHFSCALRRVGSDHRQTYATVLIIRLMLCYNSGTNYYYYYYFLPAVGVPEGGKKLIVKERKMLILQWPVIRAVLVSKALV